jgi:hypothetical protein
MPNVSQKVSAGTCDFPLLVVGPPLDFAAGARRMEAARRSARANAFGRRSRLLL